MQEELRQASMITPRTEAAREAVKTRESTVEASNLQELTLPSGPQTVRVDFDAVEPSDAGPSHIEHSITEPASVATKRSAAPAALQPEGSKPASPKEAAAAPTEMVIPFNRRPPFVSGPFKERVKVPSIKLVPVTDPKSTGASF